LALQRVREQGGNFTAPGIRATFSDAIGRITDARGNYDHALVRALQMGMTMGGMGGYPGLEAFNRNSYDDGDLDFYIKDRPVIADSLGLSERLTQLASVANMPPALQAVALKEMDYSDKVIEEVVADTETQTRNAARGFAQGVFGNQNQQPADNAQEYQDNQQNMNEANNAAEQTQTG
jgi:hypothetical protein